MPFITQKSLCKFCKHYEVQSGKPEIRQCKAFPNGIPMSIYRSEAEYDHREPYSGDNGTQFERLYDEDELKKRFPRFSPDHFMDTVEYAFNETTEMLNIGRRNGYIQPPLLNETKD